jgi:hypothetical protein
MSTPGPFQQSFRIAETRISTRTGGTQAMPDNRVLLTLDDGRSFLIDGERLTPQSDGTYHVQLVSGDELDNASSGPGES